MNDEDTEVQRAGERLCRLIEQSAPGRPLPVEKWEPVLKPLLRSSFPKRYVAGGRTIDECFRREGARRRALIPLARDVRTPPGTLQRLVDRLQESTSHGATFLYPDPRLTAAIAANPNAPPESLGVCAAYCPREFCRNPAVPLLALEDSSFVRHLSHPAAGRVLRRADAPGPLLAAFAAGNWGAGRPDTPDRAEEARLHVGLAGEATSEEWEDEARAFWLRHAANLSEWTEWEALTDFAAVGLLPDGRLLRVIPGAEEWAEYCDSALNPVTGPERLGALVKEATPPLRDTDRVALRAALALNPGTPHPLPEHDHLPRRLAGYTLRADSPDRAREMLRDCVRGWWASRRPEGAPLLTLLLLLDAPPPRTPRRSQRSAAVSMDWRMRLVAALTLPASAKQGANLLGSLTADGNRLVRAAAKARREDPSRVFRFGAGGDGTV